MTPLLQGCLCKPAVRVQEFTMSRACHKSNITNMISQKPKKKENRENTDIFTRLVNRYLQSTLFIAACSIMIDQTFKLCIWATIQHRSWEGCMDVWTFWNCVFESSKEFYVFFKFLGNFDAQILTVTEVPKPKLI